MQNSCQLLVPFNENWDLLFGSFPLEFKLKVCFGSKTTKNLRLVFCAFLLTGYFFRHKFVASFSSSNQKTSNSLCRFNITFYVLFCVIVFFVFPTFAMHFSCQFCFFFNFLKKMGGICWVYLNQRGYPNFFGSIFSSLWPLFWAYRSLGLLNQFSKHQFDNHKCLFFRFFRYFPHNKSVGSFISTNRRASNLLCRFILHFSIWLSCDRVFFFCICKIPATFDYLQFLMKLGARFSVNFSDSTGGSQFLGVKIFKLFATIVWFVKDFGSCLERVFEISVCLSKVFISSVKSLFSATKICRIFLFSHQNTSTLLCRLNWNFFKFFSVINLFFRI